MGTQANMGIWAGGQKWQGARCGRATAPRQSHQVRLESGASVRLEWGQVRYFQSSTGEWKLNSKDAPCNPPFDGMTFKGYDISQDRTKVDAFFVRNGASTRRPNRSSGGANKQFHEALHHAKRHGSADDVENLKKSLYYVSKVRRTLGVNDPEI